MNQIAVYLYSALSLFLGILALFFGFKAKQANGAWRMNDKLTRLGSGSFFTGIKATAMVIVWGTLCLGAVVGALGAFGYIDKVKSQAASERAAESQAASSTPQPVEVQQAASAPISQTEAAVVGQKELAVEIPQQGSSPVALQVGSEVGQGVEGQNPKALSTGAGSSPAIPSSNPRYEDGAAGQGTTSIVVSTNAIQICENTSDLSGKNNCRWEQCAKPENVNKPECQPFQKRP